MADTFVPEIGESAASIATVVHDSLAQLGLSALPHECSVIACPGRYRWIGFTELLKAAKYALSTAKLPVEAQTMLAGAITKLEIVAESQRQSTRSEVI